MYCDFYSFHDDVDFSVYRTSSNMLKFQNEFCITYKGITFTSYCKSYAISTNVDLVEYPYMMRKRVANSSWTYVLYIFDKIYLFTLNKEFSLDFEKWLSQFPIVIDLEDKKND